MVHIRKTNLHVFKKLLKVVRLVMIDIGSHMRLISQRPFHLSVTGEQVCVCVCKQQVLRSCSS